MEWGFCIENRFKELLLIKGKGIHSTSDKDAYISKDFGKLKFSVPEFIRSDVELNKLINSISNDEDTILFFSINPNNVSWASEAEQTLVYQFGKITSKENVFVLNLNIDYNAVQSLEFFAPASNDEITSQQTKLSKGGRKTHILGIY